MILFKRNFLSHWSADETLHLLLSIGAILCIALLFLIIFSLVRESWPILSAGRWISLIISESWHPLEGQFGLLPMMIGTLAIVAGSLVMAVPLALAAAIYVCYFAAPASSHIFRLILGLIAGVPSVVYGLWGLSVLVPLIATVRPPGASVLAAVCVLSIMILPTIALAAISALQAVPQTTMAAASALGITRKGQILFVAIPAARTGISAGILLAMARALGETMAVLMVAGNVVQIPGSLFDPVRVLTANIALEMAYATDFHRASLFASGLFVTLLAFILSWWAAKKMERHHHD